MDKLERNAIEIVRTLKKAGFETYYAGGCVRDMVMGHKPIDYDIATNAPPDEVVKLFARTAEVGARFGVVLVIMDGKPFEVATFRSESSYTDGRRPDSVEFTTPEKDVQRRDFTVNGLLYDPLEEKTLDFVDGVRDIKAGVIRTIGDPYQRFSEDKLRMIRAVRFAARFGFEIEPATFDGIRKNNSKILQVSWERIGEELTKILIGPNPDVALELLKETGLLEQILPEVQNMIGVSQPEEFHPEGDVFEHTKLALKLMKEPNEITAFALLLHDVGKPLTYEERDRIRFHNHDVVGARMAEDICQRLKFSNHRRKKIVFCIANHMRMMHAPKMRESKLKKLLRQETFPEELELHRLDCLASHKNLDVYEFLKHQYENMPEEVMQPPPLIDGDDLIALGFGPGPIFKEILSQVEELQLENQLTTKKQALKWVQKNYPASNEAP